MLIAYRELVYAPRGQPRVKIPIRMFAPEDIGGGYKCRFEIDWPDEKLQFYGAGHDEFQAIHLTLQMIGLRIYMSKYHQTGRLWYESPGSGYGFPVPRTTRDLLVGEDKKWHS